jgi:hypothetical protein
MAPAATAKVAVEAPEAIVTAEGAVSRALFEDREIDVASEAALERATVHVLDAPEARLVGEQLRELSVAVASRSMEAVLELL